MNCNLLQLHEHFFLSGQIKSRSSATVTSRTNQNHSASTSASKPATRANGAPAAKTSSSAAAEQRVQEISRLGALCETRTKELNRAKLHLRQTAAGFEAMSVLVNFLAQDVSDVTTASLSHVVCLVSSVQFNCSDANSACEFDLFTDAKKSRSNLSQKLLFMIMPPHTATSGVV